LELFLILPPLIHADNRTVFAQLPEGSVDLILTDPPYKDYQSNRPVAHNKVKKIHVAHFDVEYFLAESARVLKPGAHFYCWCDHLTFPGIVAEMERQAGRLSYAERLNYKNCLVWVKNNHGSGDLKGNYAPQHEFIIFASKGKGRPLNPPRPSNVLFRREDGEIKFYHKVSNYRFQHGTAKPVEILELLIKASTQPGELVFDPYAGSMSTGEAAIRTGRKYLMVELEEEHFLRGAERLKEVESAVIPTQVGIKTSQT